MALLLDLGVTPFSIIREDKMLIKKSDRTTSLLTALLVIFLGIVSIVVILVIKINIERAIDEYENVVNVNLTCKDSIDDLTQSIYKENFYLYGKIFLTEDYNNNAYNDYSDINLDIKSGLEVLKENKINDNYDLIFQSISSQIEEYLTMSETLQGYIDSGKISIAKDYVNNVINKKLISIISQIDSVEEQINADVVVAQNSLKYSLINISIISVVAIIVIILTTLFIVYLCNKITSKLEDYSDILEFKVDKQSKEITEHNNRIMGIQNSTIDAMASLIESRDGDTGSHIARTSAYVRMLAVTAREQGYFTNTLTKDYIEFLVKAAPMHDIGKINVPDSILKKPGILTFDEYTVMQNHTKEGGRIIREALGTIEEVEFINIASDVATFHHEKWDGSGYPYGLKADEIPISARIMAVADVFDALVSERCYKRAYSFEEAMKIIDDNRGKHFDPIISRLFIENQEKVREIMEEFS